MERILKKSCLIAVVSAFFCLLPFTLAAQETQCAQVVIQIAQELTFERQAFDAEMRIHNALTTQSVENVQIDVEFKDEAGNPVTATSDPFGAATFFITLDEMTGINDVSGSGTIAPETEAVINWLIVPTAGAAGGSLTGKLYFVGATLQYTLDGEANTVEVAPDFIVVEPQPEFEIDYFLTQDVQGDNPSTPEIEPPVPFTLGVRISNVGLAPAVNTQIDSAQPVIVDNQQSLAVNFMITGSFVDDQPAQPSLLIDFGDIGAGVSKTGRWVMESSLSGTFTSFSASYTHAAEYGGQLTSLITSLNSHLLIKDVRVDLPGRDSIKDFLAQDALIYNLYESEGIDAQVADYTTGLTLVPNGSSGSIDNYYIDVPQTAGPLYVKVPDPLNGTKVVVHAERDDGKVIPLDNAWYSVEGTGGSQTFHLNIFDLNGGGRYFINADTVLLGPQPPVLGFIPDVNATAGNQVGFIVQASDPEGVLPTLSLDSAPVGASFTDHGDGTGSFLWPTTSSQVGLYPLTFRASDGALEDVQTMYISLTNNGDSDGDGLADVWELLYFGDLTQDGSSDYDGDGLTNAEEEALGTDPTLEGNAPSVPVIEEPLFGHEVQDLQPLLSVFNSTAGVEKPTYDFELYAEEEMLTLLDSLYSVVEDSSGSTVYQPSLYLTENKHYYWRARAKLIGAASEWVYGSFYVNQQNDSPTLPTEFFPSNSLVRGGSPLLMVRNAVDPEGDKLFYKFELAGVVSGQRQVFATHTVVESKNKEFTSWKATIPSHVLGPFAWRVTISDGVSGAVISPWAKFKVDYAHPPVGLPLAISPIAGERVTTSSVTLVTKLPLAGLAPGQRYEYQISDNADFDGVVIYAGLVTGPVVTATALNLFDNVHYHWRMRVVDGLYRGPWAYGDFIVDTLNDAPVTAELVNPGTSARVDLLSPYFRLSYVSDAENDDVSYEFELYDDPQLTNLIDATKLVEPIWQLEKVLTNNTTYYWRHRTVDSLGAVSDWSDMENFFVSEDSVDDPPMLQLVNPLADITVAFEDDVSVRWVDADPDSNAKIMMEYQGTLYPLGQNEDVDRSQDVFVFPEGRLPPGVHDISIGIDDGANPVVIDSSCCTITVKNPDTSLDTDGDGVHDYADNCPYTFNPGQQDRGGLLQSTPDGVGDECQCGDVNGDGVINDNDSIDLRNALNPNPVGSAINISRPDLCNIVDEPACSFADYKLLNAYIRDAHAAAEGSTSSGLLTGPLPALCEPALH